MGLVIGGESFKTTRTVYHLICLAMKSLKIFVSIQLFKLYGCHVHFFYNAVNEKQNCEEFFSKTAFMHVRAINYTKKTIAYFIFQSLLKILS